VSPPGVDAARGHPGLAPPVATVAAARDRGRLAADLVTLSKPRVVLMILVTTAVGYRLGVTGVLDWVRLAHALVGTALAAGGTLALNQYWERDLDARMERTRGRPLPDGRLLPREALGFGVTLTALGLLYLGVLLGALALGVTAATALLYLLAYTPLKRRTPFCTLVGAVPGALPPVTGWAAARGDLGPGAWVLFGILFVWQLPHTLAIARLHREDYARAGVRFLPVVDPEGTSTERLILAGCLALLVVSTFPVLVGFAGPVYLAGACALGATFAAVGARQALAPSPPAVRRVLLASLIYLPALLALLAWDKT